MNKFLAFVFSFLFSTSFASIEDLKLIYEMYRDTEGLQFFSQYGQDRYVYQKFFKNKKNGVFVDIGANDGVTLSNTYFFEKNMGWKGICIEPIPGVFEQLQNARTALCVNGCIYSGADTISFLHIKGEGEMLSGIIKDYNPAHFDRVQGELDGSVNSAEVLTVPCYDLTQLLLDYELTHVDYLSLDTEGSELEILKSIDFNLIEIDVIDVEANHPVQDFLEPLGYTKAVHLGVDEIYIRNGWNP